MDNLPSYWIYAWHRLTQHRRIVCGLWILASLVILTLVVPICSPYSYYEIHLTQKNLPPSFQFWFGTDDLGRDLFTRLWCGARISLSIGVLAATIDLVIGVIYGAIAGLSGRTIDEVMMRLADVFYSIPYLLVAILLTVIMGSGLKAVVTALTITGWITTARITRGQVLQLKELEYVCAARTLGASDWRIVSRHLLPNALGPVITTMTFAIPAAIFTEAFLSFLGLGVQPPLTSWGTMISDGVPALRYFPWRLLFPAFFVSLTMFCLYLVGDGIRDAFDPRLP